MLVDNLDHTAENLIKLYFRAFVGTRMINSSYVYLILYFKKLSEPIIRHARHTCIHLSCR